MITLPPPTFSGADYGRVCGAEGMPGHVKSTYLIPRSLMLHNNPRRCHRPAAPLTTSRPGGTGVDLWCKHHTDDIRRVEHEI